MFQKRRSAATVFASRSCQTCFIVIQIWLIKHYFLSSRFWSPILSRKTSRSEQTLPKPDLFHCWSKPRRFRSLCFVKFATPVRPILEKWLKLRSTMASFWALAMLSNLVSFMVLSVGIQGTAGKIWKVFNRCYWQSENAGTLLEHSWNTIGASFSHLYLAHSWSICSHLFLQHRLCVFLHVWNFIHVASLGGWSWNLQS